MAKLAATFRTRRAGHTAPSQVVSTIATNQGWSIHEANAKPCDPTCRKGGCDDSRPCDIQFHQQPVTGTRRPVDEIPKDEIKRERTHSKRPPDHWSSSARPQRESFARCGIGLHGDVHATGKEVAAFRGSGPDVGSRSHQRADGVNRQAAIGRAFQNLPPFSRRNARSC